MYFLGHPTYHHILQSSVFRVHRAGSQLKISKIPLFGELKTVPKFIMHTQVKYARYRFQFLCSQQVSILVQASRFQCKVKISMPVHGTCVHATCVNRYMYTIWVGPKFWAWGENIGVGRNFRVGVKIWGLKRILGWEKILGWGEKGVFCGRSCRKSQLHQTWSFIITQHLELNAGRIFGIGRT